MKSTYQSAALSKTCLRNDERATELLVLQTELRDSNCILKDQQSYDLRPIKNLTILMNGS